MKSVALKNFPFTDLTVLGLVLFFSLFCMVIIWVFRKNSKTIYTELSNNILDQDFGEMKNER